MRETCEEMAKAVDVLARLYRGLLTGADPAWLNAATAPHKMTPGQIACHMFGAACWFMAKTPSFSKTKWTFLPIEYPLSEKAVLDVVERGRMALNDALAGMDDARLDDPWTSWGEKKTRLGYIVLRLLLHGLWHGGQIGYLRSAADPNWRLGAGFGQAATAIAAIRYGTTPLSPVEGF